MEEEIWKDILNHEGYYQVSNYGRVRSVDRCVCDSRGRYTHLTGKLLKLRECRAGYYYVGLHKNGQYNNRYVHRLVGIAFVPNIDSKPEVNHKDGVRKNNNPNNLEWVTHSENALHSVRVLGNNQDNKGENCHFNKYSEDLMRKVKYLKGKMRGCDVARKYNVDSGLVYNIWKNRKWKHL